MSIYEEVEIEDLDYDHVELIYTYPCPCGDKFRIGLEDLWDGEDIAPCPSCTLRIMIIYDEEDLPPLPDDIHYDSADETDDEEDQLVNKSEIDIAEHEKDEQSLVDSMKKSLTVG